MGRSVPNLQRSELTWNFQENAQQSKLTLAVLCWQRGMNGAAPATQTTQMAAQPAAKGKQLSMTQQYARVRISLR